MNTIVASLIAVALAVYGAQDALDGARQLYAAAAFDEALAALDRMTEVRSLPPDEAREVAEYRIFSLFALGRTADAEAAAATLITRDPFTQLRSRDASPRIQAMYDGVRARMLPQLIRDRYRAGRAAIE